MAKDGPEEGPKGGYKKTFEPDQSPTQPVKRLTFTSPVPKNSPVIKKVSPLTHVVFFIGLAVLLYAYWFFGQLTLGIPDEYIATIFTVLLYNWFVKNDYELPKWLKK